tara:strand:- start:100 stop:666 length:567 start_codon:yes stop_codon:yes gene_type:complete
MSERTLILVKHDGVVRGLIGKIVSRFEEIGFKVAGMKMVWAGDELAGTHYKLDEEWAKKVFERTKKTKEEQSKPFPYTDHMEFGQDIRQRNINFLKEGPVVAIVFEGAHAVELGRKIIGHTEPRQALPGTIRGDFASMESYDTGDKNKRTLRNLVHASDTPENAEHEIAIWFKEDELHSYPKELDKHF